MANYPESVSKIVSTSVAKYRDDIDKAIDQAKGRICLLPEYDELLDQLLTDAVRYLVLNKRHTLNIAVNRAAGVYSQSTAPKDVSALNRAATEAVNYFNYFIAGRTLGDVSGVELPDLADGEHEKGVGCFRNESILRALVPLVKGDKTVRQAVKPKQLEAIFQRVHSSVVDPQPKRGEARASTNGRASGITKPSLQSPGRNTTPAMAGD